MVPGHGPLDGRPLHATSPTRPRRRSASKDRNRAKRESFPIPLSRRRGTLRRAVDSGWLETTPRRAATGSRAMDATTHEDPAAAPVLIDFPEAAPVRA